MKESLLLSVILMTVEAIILRTPVIEIAQGKLRGIAGITQNKYLGIPYAAVEQRFQAPGSPPSWEGIFDAVQESPPCNQYISTLGTLGIAIGKEDCLGLNVYTPPYASSKRPLPVMVFIHGGGFRRGSGSSLLYDPMYLVEKGVIVVTINYRLGALGFLCLGIEGAPGNAGLKDQTAALRWVNGNIKFFGGNPRSITLFGQSAGSCSVHYQILSSMGKGLFHRAILESGTALLPICFSHDPIERASSIAKKLGYTTKDPQELLEIFRNTSAKDIVTATNNRDLYEQYVFRPCAERIVHKEPFITKNPYQILKSGIYNRVPMILGYNDKEGILYAGMQTSQSLAQYNEHFERLLPDDLRFDSDEEKLAVSQKVRLFYFDNKTVDGNSIGGLIDLISDTLFHGPSVRASQLHLKTSQQLLYNYYFKYDSLRNLVKLFSGLPTQPGATHGDELFYIFQPKIWLVPLVGKDRVMVNRMTQLWTDFAKTSDPTPTTSVLSPSPWTASNTTSLDFYNLDVNMYMRAMPNPQRIQLWKDIYDKYGIESRYTSD